MDISPSADCSEYWCCSVSKPSRCLLQSGYLGFRFLRYQCSPWLVLAIAPLKLLFASEVERIRLKLRCFSALARIDFVRVYGLLNIADRIVCMEDGRLADQPSLFS